jgi:hypothetical protein
MSLIGPVMCVDCGVMLAQEEIEFYEYRCDYCERDWMERLAAWRAGEPDEEIEKLFYFRDNCRSVH